MAGSKLIKSGTGLPDYLLPVCSGLLLILAFPRFEQGYLAWFALMPLLWFTINNPPRKAAAGGFLFGVPLSLYLNHYLATVLYNYLSIPLAIFSTVALIAIISLFNALFALVASWLRRSCSPLALTMGLPSLWVLLEYTRSLGFVGYNVGYLGYTQWQYPFVLNIAATYGYWGLPFLMVAFQSLLLLALCKQLTGRKLIISAAVWLILLGGGLLLPLTFESEQLAPEKWAALIQGNSSPQEVLSKPGRDKILQRYLNLSRRAAAAQPKVSLIVWPETVVDLVGPEVPLHKPEMQRLARELQANFLYGARIFSNQKLYNSIVALPENGSGMTLYHKHRLVPFVEYFPAEQLLNAILDLDISIGGYTAGSKETTLFNLSGMPLAGVICFESYFGDYTRRFARDGARHLFVLTNDVWFKNSIGLEQHAQVAAIRAAEAGIGVTQVANSGITISFDYRGREIFRSPKLTEEIIITPVTLDGRCTLYRRWGDYFPAFWGLFLTGLIGYSLRRRTKKGKP
ncbi:MAG TPA: apolipoprotein N-acyltransferase [Firmicutes bacterium]|nr:apolipoprotein N-acyltransferase [Bacillota bacterium]